MSTTEEKLTKLKRRRGVSKASITRIRTRVSELESTSSHPTTLESAKQLTSKLESLDSEFKSYHFELIDLLSDEDALERVLDSHDDLVSDIALRLQKLCTSTTPASADDLKLLRRKLERLEVSIKAQAIQISRMDRETDLSVLEQYQVQMTEHQSSLRDIQEDLLHVEDQSSISKEWDQHSNLAETLFDSFSSIRKLLKVCSTTHGMTSAGSGVKLPKIDVPSFDGDILQWRQFWEQFCISVHDRTNLTNAEKMVYLRQSLKNGPSRSIIEGLAQSGEQYEEAIKCLTSRYDRPRLVHQAHVRMILESPQLREGSGKELRRLHDTVQQHTRALKSMGEEPSPSFITSIVELKLDSNTMFEWQRHTQSDAETPHYQKILEFLDHRAQASEVASIPSSKKQFKGGVDHSNPKKHHSPSNQKPIPSYTSIDSSSSQQQCPLCVSEKHPLYSCTKFKQLPHDRKIMTIKSNNLCMNCLGKGHFVADCKSSHRCKKCHHPHHTLLHNEKQRRDDRSNSFPITNPVSANAVAEVSSNTTLLMTCRIVVMAPNGSSIEARALLDSASSTSFISNRLAQMLKLDCKKKNVTVSGVGDTPSTTLARFSTTFAIAPMNSPTSSIHVSALVVPRVTCDLPTSSVSSNRNWHHLDRLPLADPGFGTPGRIDVLLGVDVFTRVMLNGRKKGPQGSPVAMETTLGWVLCGSVSSRMDIHSVITYHTMINSGDDILRKFWEIEEPPSKLDSAQSSFSIEERAVMNHFKVSHTRKPDGRFVVPLPKSNTGQLLGESRSQAVRRFLTLERSLTTKNRFSEVDDVITEYFQMGHAEAVPQHDMSKEVSKTFYLPIQAVYKQASSTTKVRAVFDASAKSSTGISLNDLLLVGPTIHPPLVDVLLRFRLHRVALTADVSKMYRNIELIDEDKDLHRFVWRSDSSKPLLDYRMTRVTFGVSASSFAANMSVRQNAIDLSHEYPLAAKVVESYIYVDDCLTGADTVEDTIKLYEQLHHLFERGGFLLRKWNSSERAVLNSIDPSLLNPTTSITLSDTEQYTKALGVEWSTTHDYFRLASIQESLPPVNLTKRRFVSDIAKVFDVLGWFAPTTIRMKILLQRLWELKIDWDDSVPPFVQEAWSKWRDELPVLCKHHIQRYYFPKDSRVIATQLHGFSDASEDAYAGVVYLQGEDTNGNVYTSLVMSKTRVSPIKRLTIPRLELCGAHLLADLLDHIRKIYQIPTSEIYAWTDSTIVLNWLDGSPRRFKTYVGNRVSSIINQVPPNCWNHVQGLDNPADCASRGLFPKELSDYALWWNGPHWLKLPPTKWPQQLSPLVKDTPPEEERDICHVTVCQPTESIMVPTNYSSFSRLQRITAWIFRFIDNCRTTKTSRPTLSILELSKAERYWLSQSQTASFPKEMKALESKPVSCLPNHSILLPFCPFLDQDNMMRVGGRLTNSEHSYNMMHPIILHADHHVTKLLIRAEHIRLLHAGPTLTMSAMGLRFRVIGLRRVVRSIIRACVICKRHNSKTSCQIQGQLPPERVNPGAVFERVGVDYAGPINIKYGYVRKPVIVKAYICVFVSLAVKAVHLEIVSDLTAEAFIAALRRFTSRRGIPSLIWSDNGTNFVGSDRQLKELFEFIKNPTTDTAISEFCTSRGIEWRFIPERSPHFGGLWEAAVKSMKFHLRRVISPEIKLTYEELSTVICQIEACLNSRPLCVIQPPNNDTTEVLTPGHFLVGHSLMAVPDKLNSQASLTTLRRWHLCQSLARHFWRRWSEEYVVELNKHTKWFHKSRNIAVGDIVLLRDTTLFQTKWPLARVITVHPGKDDMTRVVTIKTEKGEYKRPITKIVLLLPADQGN